MTTDTDIANMALDLLKEAPITDITQDRPTARWLNRNFAATRDSVLSKADWNCAMKRTSLAEDGTAPAFGWTYRYAKPADCLRVLPLTYDGTSEGKPVASEIEGQWIMTNKSGPLKIRYVSRFEEYGNYPACLQEAVAAALAGKMAHWMTGKTSYAEIAKQAFREAMNDAWLVDAIEGTTPRAADSEWIDAR